MGFKVAAVMIQSPSVRPRYLTVLMLCGIQRSTVFTVGIALALHGTG